MTHHAPARTAYAPKTDAPTADETMPSRDDLRRLLDIVTRLNTVTDSEALLAHIIDTAAEVLGCDAASLLLYDAETDRLRFVAATGSDAATLAEIPVPLHGSIAGAIFREGTSVNIRRVEDDARHFGEVGKKVSFETQSLLGVPMRMEGEVVGVLEALNKRGGDFSRRDEHLLSLLADQVAVTLRNVRQREQLRAAYERLAQMEATKSSFLTLTSHELRTPLATIQGFASIIREEARDDTTRDHANLIVESAVRMTEVVEILGAFNGLRLGRNAPDTEVLCVERLLRRAWRSIEPQARSKGQEVCLKPTAPDLYIGADVPRLEMALQLLLANAVLYTPPGGTITLRAKADDRPEAAGVRIQVEDTGCGLAPEHLEAVFKEYFQVEDALTRSHGGLGLGLTVVRGIAALHEGRVWAESPGVGQGATFSLWLPRIDDDATAEA